jgi:hypothetical protein
VSHLTPEPGLRQSLTSSSTLVPVFPTKVRKLISLEDIIVPEGRMRSIQEEGVERLMAGIRKQGFQGCISVMSPAEGKYRLVAGAPPGRGAPASRLR